VIWPSWRSSGLNTRKGESEYLEAGDYQRNYLVGAAVVWPGVPSWNRKLDGWAPAQASTDCLWAHAVKSDWLLEAGTDRRSSRVVSTPTGAARESVGGRRFASKVDSEKQDVRGAKDDVPDSMPVRFRRHGSGVRWQQAKGSQAQRVSLGAPSAHRRPGYPLVGCAPAEPTSVSPGVAMILGRKGIQQAQELAQIDPKGGVIGQSKVAENGSQ
jgi:hypothetical protein